MAAKKRSFGAVLREARVRRKLTMGQLATKLDIKSSYISYLEADQRRPSIEVLARLVKVLRLDGREMLLLAYPDAKALVIGGRRGRQ